MKIAEIGLAHDGQISKAIELIELAKQKGYDAIKFQKRSAGHWFSDATPRPDSPFGKTLGEHRHKLELTIGMHKLLQKQAHGLDLMYGASVWDPFATIEIHQLLTEKDFLKVGRPSNDKLEILLTINQLLSIKKVMVVVSCRSEIEASYVKMHLRDHLDCVKILFCPGNYPDRPQDLPEELPKWTNGVSLHHPDEDFGSHLQSEISERHVALKSTIHRDKAWSLILDSDK